MGRANCAVVGCYAKNSVNRGLTFHKVPAKGVNILIIIMYIYHALINALRAHMIHINLHMIFYTHVEHSPTKTIYIK